MTFTNFLQVIAQVFTSIFSWLVKVAAALYNNFIFKIIFYLLLVAFLINILLTLFNKVNKNENISLEILDDLEEEEEDYWEDNEIRESDFE